MIRSLTANSLSEAVSPHPSLPRVSCPGSFHTPSCRAFGVLCPPSFPLHFPPGHQLLPPNTKCSQLSSPLVHRRLPSHLEITIPPSSLTVTLLLCPPAFWSHPLRSGCHVPRKGMGSIFHIRSSWGSGKLRKMCPPGRWTERPQSPRRYQVPRSKEENIWSSDLDATYILRIYWQLWW